MRVCAQSNVTYPLPLRTHPLYNLTHTGAIRTRTCALRSEERQEAVIKLLTWALPDGITKLVNASLMPRLALASVMIVESRTFTRPDVCRTVGFEVATSRHGVKVQGCVGNSIRTNIRLLMCLGTEGPPNKLTTNGHLEKSEGTKILRESLAIKILRKKRIVWTSGEAYIPGPPQRSVYLQRNAKSSTYNIKHLHDLRIRFHNVQGLADSAFRSYYLHKARRSCDILVLAETNCIEDKDEIWWRKDWKAGAGTFWARAPKPSTVKGSTCRGMAILFSNKLGKIDATCIWNDPEGRGIAVKANIYGKDFVIIGFHADNTSDVQQAKSFKKVQEAIQVDPNMNYIWCMDANNVVNPGLDSKRTGIARTWQDRPKGVRQMLDSARDIGGMRDAFRTLFPNKKEYTRVTNTVNNEENIQKTFKRIDKIFVSGSLLRQDRLPTLIDAVYIFDQRCKIKQRLYKRGQPRSGVTIRRYKLHSNSHKHVNRKWNGEYRIICLRTQDLYNKHSEIRYRN